MNLGRASFLVGAASLVAWAAATDTASDFILVVALVAGVAAIILGIASFVVGGLSASGGLGILCGLVPPVGLFMLWLALGDR